MKGVAAVLDRARNSSAAFRYGSLEGSCMPHPIDSPTSEGLDADCGGVGAQAVGLLYQIRRDSAPPCDLGSTRRTGRSHQTDPPARVGIDATSGNRAPSRPGGDGWMRAPSGPAPPACSTNHSAGNRRSRVDPTVFAVQPDRPACARPAADAGAPSYGRVRERESSNTATCCLVPVQRSPAKPVCPSKAHAQAPAGLIMLWCDAPPSAHITGD